MLAVENMKYEWIFPAPVRAEFTISDPTLRIKTNQKAIEPAPFHRLSCRFALHTIHLISFI
jgi:hypothetical protein